MQSIEGEGSGWAWSLAVLMTEMPTGDAQGLGFAPEGLLRVSSQKAERMPREEGTEEATCLRRVARIQK